MFFMDWLQMIQESWFLQYYAYFAIPVLWPVVRITARTGHHPLFGSLILVPFLGLVLLAAFLVIRPWPALNEGQKT